MSSFLTGIQKDLLQVLYFIKQALQHDGIILHFPHNILVLWPPLNFSSLHHFHLDGRYPNWRVYAYEKYSQLHSSASNCEKDYCVIMEGLFEIEPSNTLKPVWILAIFKVLDEDWGSRDAGQSLPLRLLGA